MNVEFSDRRLEKLAAGSGFDGGFGVPVARAFRKVVNLLRSAADERDLYQFKSLHFEKLKGNRAHQRSLRLNDQFRLIVELASTKPKSTVVVISIEDYH